MIKLENTQVSGFEPAIRGMRNPMNSWDKSDSWFFDMYDTEYRGIKAHRIGFDSQYFDSDEYFALILDLDDVIIGPNDHDLMMRLNAGGSEHSKYRRMIVVYVDVTAPLYWWKEMDTYKVGTVANSCSTMHKIHSKPFELDDFSNEKLFSDEDQDDEPNALLRAVVPSNVYNDDIAHPLDVLDYTITMLNRCRTAFNVASRRLKEDETLTDSERKHIQAQAKRYWWQMIQLLPTSYNQKRTLMLNYEVLASIYRQRKGHKLDEWHAFREWIESLPYSELITGEREKAE